VRGSLIDLGIDERILLKEFAMHGNISTSTSVCVCL
jgi:hypothetical protein